MVCIGCIWLYNLFKLLYEFMAMGTCTYTACVYFTPIVPGNSDNWVVQVIFPTWRLWSIRCNTVDKKVLKKSHSMDRNKMELFWAIFNHCVRTIIGRLLKKGLVGLNSLMLLKKLLTILTFLNCAIYRFNAGRKKKNSKNF